MSERAKARILILDPDADFLQSIKSHPKSQKDAVEYIVFGKKQRPKLANFIMNEMPDIVVIHLDHDQDEDFGSAVREICEVPIAPRPLICGITRNNDRFFLQKAFEGGIDDCLVQPVDPLFLWLKLDVWARMRGLQLDFDHAARRLSHLNAKLTNANQKLEELSITDELTGLHNMRYMTESLEKHFTLLRRYERPFSVLMLDLDKFKNVNDQNDHLVGSATIKEVGAVIEACTRNTDIKARYGGDEYIVAMPETDLKSGLIVAERLREAIAANVVHISDEVQIQVTASLGIATFEPDRHIYYTDLVKDADRAMYQAKESGRNRVCHYGEVSIEGYDESQSSVIAAVKKVKAS